MKKFNLISSLVIALATLFACQQTGPETPSFEFQLKNSNVIVENAEFDYIVSVSGNTATITLDYLDKLNSYALTVKFVGLPEGVSVTGFKDTFDYASNSSQIVKFAKEGESGTVDYTVKVVLAAPQPKFIHAGLNGVDVIDGVAKLSVADDLTKVFFTYTASPDFTDVYIGEQKIESGCELDFSDKVNGITFTLKCEGVTATETIKASTAGITTVTRVWGHYVKPTTVEDTWFGTKVNGTLDLLRTVALNDEYVFLSRDVRKEDNVVVEKTGAYAIKISDSNDVTAMSTNGFGDGDRIFALSVLGDNCIVATFAMAAGAHFKIFKYDTVTSDPVCVLDYVLPETARLGDRITVEGDWTNGAIMAYDNTSGTKVYCFEVAGGTVSSTPRIIDLDTKGGTYSGLYKHKDGYYMLGGNAAAMYFTVSGTTGTMQFTLATASYSAPMHGIQFFTVNDMEYMGYVVLQNSFTDGQFRITPLSGETLQEALEAVPNPYVFWLGDPNSKEVNNGDKNGNGLGMGMFRKVGDHNYYVAYVPGTGISLFDIQ